MLDCLGDLRFRGVELVRHGQTPREPTMIKIASKLKYMFVVVQHELQGLAHKNQKLKTRRMAT
jgi:hypothetical protein